MIIKCMVVCNDDDDDDDEYLILSKQSIRKTVTIDKIN